MDTKTYMAWWCAKRRCENKNDIGYKNYGGRGIKMHWKTYSDFVKDMGIAPNGLTLDRIDNDGNYEPKNCRWVSRKINSRNRRCNRMLTANGKTLCLAEWVEVTEIKRNCIYMRLESGWTDAQSLGLQDPPRNVKTNCRNGHPFTEPGDCPKCVKNRNDRYYSRLAARN